MNFYKCIGINFNDRISGLKIDEEVEKEERIQWMTKEMTKVVGIQKGEEGYGRIKIQYKNKDVL